MEITIPTNCEWVIGIDEAGRGPIAGPVTVGAAICRSADYAVLLETIPSFIVGRDSKKLTAKARDNIFAEMIASNLVQSYVFSVPNTDIDDRGIIWSIKAALRQCLEAHTADPSSTLVLLDGGLKAPEEFPLQQTIIKGDEKVPLIGLASIAAKVTRDQEMAVMATTYPDYGFEKHKGYGTKGHYEALKKCGPSSIHRMSFLKNDY